MAAHKWSDLKKARFTRAQIEKSRAKAEEAVLAMNLRAVRDLIGKTQIEVAKAADLAQGELSKIERREDHLVSTLRKYVEALGGELEVVAKFGNKSIRLTGV